MKNFVDLSQTQQLERWQQVVRVLKGLSRHERRRHWDMSTFGTKTECGTIACAAGHCGMDPWFRRRGFQLNKVGDAHVHTPTLVEQFFGPLCGIFFNTAQRPVPEVIREVQSAIRGWEQERS